MSEQRAMTAGVVTARLVYSSGNFGKNILASSTEILLMFVMTEMMGVAPLLAGALLLGSLLIDALLDPVVGMLTDRIRGPLGRHGPMILIGAPLCGACFALMFALPARNSDNLVLLTVLLFGFRAAYSLLDVPHNALISAVAPPGAERARLSAYRFFFSTLATLTLALVIRPMTAPEEAGGLSAQGLADVALAIGVLAAAVIVLAWVAVWPIDRGLGGPGTNGSTDFARFKALVASPFVVRVLCLGALAAFGLPLFSKGMLYLAQDVLEDTGAASSMLGAMVVGQFIGLALWIPLAARVAEAGLLRIAHCVAGFGLIAAILAVSLGLPALLAACMVIGIGAAGVYAFIWALVGNAADRLRAERGFESGGLCFGLAIVTQKAAIGLGSLTLGLGLQTAQNEVFPWDRAEAVVACCLLIPSIAMAVCAWLTGAVIADARSQQRSIARR